MGGLRQAPLERPPCALKYLARYTHRVAIGNSRLQSIDDGQVAFTYKDYRHRGRQRTLTLAATEFIRRFMMHVLPRGFVRIRYYGFLANAHREEQLQRIRQLLGAPQPAVPDEPSSDLSQDPIEPAPDQRCPHCREGLMRAVDIAPRPRLSEILKLPLLAPT